jgi:hypothetical protein
MRPEAREPLQFQTWRLSDSAYLQYCLQRQALKSSQNSLLQVVREQGLQIAPEQRSEPVR